MELISFPALNANDIEIRVNRIAQGNESYRLELLLYKDARCDMRMLDEVVGAMNWQRKHEIINGINYCTVSIRDKNGEWVSKQDCGTAGEFEADKAASSDAFKRACFNWGIGRELYTVPAVGFWNTIDGDVLANVKQNKNGKLVCYDRFIVKNIGVQDHVITSLQVYNETTQATVWDYIA